ncbi:hypothetical protein PMAC_001279 [Pneumocystis sp. 'macacae']|nr:hypothetical protein PMAC_001279 [Pneumocystis sp. 'macacae']
MNDASLEINKDYSEKKINLEHDDVLLNDSKYDTKYDRKLLRRIDCITIPMMIIFYLLSFLDRTNIGNARLAGLEKDLNLTEEQFKMSLTILYIPYILMEIPSNLIIKKIGPNRWLPTLVVLWGTVATLQGIVKDYRGLYANRFFLGLTEGGILPGIILYLSDWYKRHEIQFRIGIFWSASSISGAFGGFIAAMIQLMSGLGGLNGWSWIFIIEGLITVIFGLLGYWLVPRSIEKTRFLTKEQKYWARKRIELDEQRLSSLSIRHPVTGEMADYNKHLKWSYVKSCFTTLHIYLLSLLAFSSGTNVYSIAYFLPTIVKSLTGAHRPVYITQLLTVPPFILTFVVVMITSYYSDKKATLGFFILCVSYNNIVNYLSLFLLVCGLYCVFPSEMALTSNNVSGYYRRATALGFMIVMSNLGGILASWVFNANEHPRYITSYAVNIALSALCSIVAFVLRIYYARQNKERDKLQSERIEPVDNEVEFYKAREQDKENLTSIQEKKPCNNIYDHGKDFLNTDDHIFPIKTEKTGLSLSKNINSLLLDESEFEFINQHLSQTEKISNSNDKIFDYTNNVNSLSKKMILEQDTCKLEIFQENKNDAVLANQTNLLKSGELITTKGMFARTSYGKSIYFYKKHKKIKNSNIVNFENYCGISIHKLCNFSDNLKYSFDYNDYRFSQTPEYQLWTNKHAPKKFTDLLGDERVHRETLRWIKHWDFCVFGKYCLQSKIFEDENDFNCDFLKRPKQKILILTGPPGLGKTTLAHIAARQAGYNIIEINASDDRTGAVVKNQISNVLDIQSIHTNRPTLIIIDEIDGVNNSAGEQGFIKSLVDILVDDDYATKDIFSTNSTTYSKKKKIKFKKKILLRPIICICNDLYTTALRPIRQYAKIIYFKQTSTSSLISRMHVICKIEGLSINTQILTTLCEIFENDFRSCLNALQFYKTNEIDLTMNSLNMLKTKLKKDSSKSLNLILDKIFFFSNKNYKKNASENYNMFMEIYETIQNYGDYEKLINNCFIRYLLQDYKDDRFSKPILAGDWLFFFDILNSFIYERQNIELLSYLVFPLLIFHILFVSVKYDYKHNYQQNLKLNSDWEFYESQRINNEIYASLYYGSVPRLQQIFCLKSLLIDVVPYLVYILLPRLKPINLQLLKNAEKQTLSRVINTMICFNITYSQTKADDGTFIYKFEPPIETLITFTFLKKHEPIFLKYSTCQIINMELENEKLRIQKQRYIDNSNKPLNVTLGYKRKSDKSFDLEQHYTKDFFGRIVSKSANNKNQKNVDDKNKVFIKPNSKVWVKFHEGYSNAIKKPIPIEDILK